MDRDMLADQIRGQITKLHETRDSVDPAARAELLQQIDNLEGLLSDIRIQDDDEIARQISESIDALERVRTERGLDAVSVLSNVIDELSAAEHSVKRHYPPPPPTPKSSLAMRAAVPIAAVTAAASAVIVAQAIRTRTSKKFDDLKDEYADLFGRCVARPEREGEIKRMSKRIRANRERYEAVGKPLGIPWHFIGIAHALEGNLNFGTHLHNGDPLTTRTVQEPKNRPAAGSPPFSWEESAADALRLKKLHQNADWSTPHILYLLEGFNGYGYRALQLPSPYLWSFSNIYEKGKYVKDHAFDPEAVSRQCGAALLLQALAQR